MYYVLKKHDGRYPEIIQLKPSPYFYKKLSTRNTLVTVAIHMVILVRLLFDVVTAKHLQFSSSELT